jgi:protein TonB
LNELNEFVCDDLTIAGTESSTVDYTKQLLQFSESYSNSSPPIPSTLTFTESYKLLKNRLSYHLSKKEGVIMKNNHLKSRIAIIVCIVAMIPLLGQCNKEEPIPTSDDDAESISTGDMKSNDQNEPSYSYDELTVKPDIIHKEMPAYPETARKKGIGGLVVVKVTIDESGNVIDATIFSSENSVLDEAALEAAKKCRFKSAEKDGQRVKANLNLPFKFAIR